VTPNNNYTSPTTKEMLTQTRRIMPFEPDTFSPMLSEIITALPKINRYNGHTIFPYSVAQHSLLCQTVGIMYYNCTAPHYQLFFLLHDAPEAYLQDIIRPIKQYISDVYLETENKILDKLIGELLTPEQIDDINDAQFQHVMHDIDSRIAVTEVNQLMSTHSNPLPGYAPYDIIISERYWRDVAMDFFNAIDTNIKRLEEQLK
jgi:hypothetical protein